MELIEVDVARDMAVCCFCHLPFGDGERINFAVTAGGSSWAWHPRCADLTVDLVDVEP